MGDRTAIEWTDATWNPVTGCTKVSQGCKHCYAERVFKRPYPSREFTDVKCHPERLDQPLRWTKPRRIFVNSMSDLFHEAVPDGFLDQVFGVMALADHHTFQVLTKRPERLRQYLNTLGDGKAPDRVTYAANKADFRQGGLCARPLPNVQLGVSCEDQETADERIPLLLQTPAAVRFLSLEPLLGAIDLRRIKTPADPNFLCQAGRPPARIDWVIVGGESGPNARPMHPDWVRSLRDQCVAAGVPFFFKQWGEWRITEDKDLAHEVIVPVDRTSKCGDERRLMTRVGKKAAGAMLDGREWREYPGHRGTE
jgi:protein gp37